MNRSNQKTFVSFTGADVECLQVMSIILHWGSKEGGKEGQLKSQKRLIKDLRANTKNKIYGSDEKKCCQTLDSRAQH